jgi:hypothetical protein
MRRPCLPRATILIALSGNGRCSAFASSHGAHPNIALLIRHQDRRHRPGCIGSTMAFGEDRSQTDVRERLSAVHRSEVASVLHPAARSRRTTPGAAAGEAGKAEGEDISAGMVGRVDLGVPPSCEHAHAASKWCPSRERSRATSTILG